MELGLYDIAKMYAAAYFLVRASQAALISRDRFRPALFLFFSLILLGVEP